MTETNTLSRLPTYGSDMSYRTKPFGERLRTMGDLAEGVYEKVEPLGPSLRVGWRRPKLSMRYMSEEIKHSPDYYAASGYLIEVMGLGQDDILKLKVEKYEALKSWNLFQPLVLFIWNSARNTWAVLEWPKLKACVQKARNAGIEKFENDGREYFPILWSWIEEAAALKGQYDGA